MNTDKRKADVPVRRWRTPRGRRRFSIDVLAARRAMADGTLSVADREFIDAVIPGLMEKLGPLDAPAGVEEKIVGGARGFTYTAGKKRAR